MRTYAVQQQILSGYERLCQLAQVPEEEGFLTSWGFYNHNNSGFISQRGTVSLPSSLIQIKGNEIQLQRKPLFTTWRSVLTEMSKMLQDTIANYGDGKVVEMRLTRLLCFSPKQSKVLLEHVSKMHR